MSARRDYWGCDADTPDVAPDADPLEWARYWNAQSSGEDVLNYTLIDIAESLRRIANHLDRKDTTA